MEKTIAPAVTPSMPKWIEFMFAREGWTEFDHDKELSKDWPLVGLDYKTVIGTSHAWCGMEAYAALHFAGYKGPRGAAGAANWRTWGDSCEWLCGAALPMRHASGGAHITFFLAWADRLKKLALCIGGNQNNAVRVSLYNLSGNRNGHDEVVNGPKLPHGYTHNGYIYTPRPKDLALIPGGSTR